MHAGRLWQLGMMSIFVSKTTFAFKSKLMSVISLFISEFVPRCLGAFGFLKNSGHQGRYQEVQARPVN